MSFAFFYIRASFEEMKRIIIIVFIAVCTLSASAQDAHFSQFHAMPLWLNPAQTGFHNGLVRSGVIYRNQWLPVAGFPASLQTVGGFADARLFKEFLKKDYFGAGGSVLIDRGGTNLFQNGNAAINFAYSKGFGRNVKHAIALGVGVELMFQHFNAGKAAFSDGIRETFNNNILTFDANIGMQYHVVFREKVNAYVGFAYHHLMQSTSKFTEFSNERWRSKYVGHLGLQVEVNNRWNLVPSAMFMYQNTSWQLNIGAAGQYVFGDKRISRSFLAFGLNTRLVQSGLESVIPNVKLDIYNISVGLSYDINTSLLAFGSKTYGALEIALGYTLQSKGKQRLWAMPCPNF